MDGQRFFNDMFLIKRRYDQFCKPLLLRHDLRQSDLDVLLCLASNPNCRTAGEISECRLVPKSQVSSSVDALTRKGLLMGEVDPQDRRRVLLTLLPPARQIIDEAFLLSDAYFQQMLSGTSDEDLRTLDRVSTQLISNLNSGNGAASTPL